MIPMNILYRPMKQSILQAWIAYLQIQSHEKLEYSKAVPWDGFYILKMRVAFNIAIRATPISPNTASHIEAIPTAPSRIKTPFTESENIKFCQTIFRVFRAIR